MAAKPIQTAAPKTLARKREAVARSERAALRRVMRGAPAQPVGLPPITGAADGKHCMVCVSRFACQAAAMCADHARKVADRKLEAEGNLLPGERIVHGAVWIYDMDLRNAYLAHKSGRKRDVRFEPRNTSTARPQFTMAAE